MITQLQVRLENIDQLISGALKQGSCCYRGEWQTKEWFLEFLITNTLKKREMSIDKGESHIISTEMEDCLRGPFPLPLHTDGVLSQKRVDLTVLFCEKAKCRGGQTILVPEASVSRLIEEDFFEYSCTYREYYDNTPKLWFRIPTRIKKRIGQGNRLNIALPFVGRFKVENPSFRVRLVGKTEEESLAYFISLTEKVFSQDFASPYLHDWKEGDLMVIDHDTVLHGRLAFEPGDERVLIREQFVLD